MNCNCINCEFYEGDDRTGFCSALPPIRATRSGVDGCEIETFDFETHATSAFDRCILWRPIQDGDEQQ